MSLASRKADLLLALSAGLVGVEDVVAMAARGDQAAASLGLRHVLSAAGVTQARVVAARYCRLSGERMADPPLRTVADPRAGGRRVGALAAALWWRGEDWPWTGFPWTDPPEGWVA